MAGKIKIISGVDDSNNSIKLDKQFKIELTNDAYNAIPGDTPIQKVFDWNVETPNGNTVQGLNNASNKSLTTKLSTWGDNAGIYRFYVTTIAGEDEQEVADISITGLASDVNPEDENIIETLAPFVSSIENIIDGNKISLTQTWNQFSERVNFTNGEKKTPNSLFNSVTIGYKVNDILDLNTFLNFGDDNKILITNVKTDREVFNESPYSAVFKLYEPLPDDIEERSQLFVVREILPQLTETVELVPYAQEDEGVLVLKTPESTNVDSPITNRSTELKSYNDLVTTNKDLKNQILDKYLTGSQQPIELNADYSNYENFVNFSSAEKRLSNFKYKLELIESYTAQSSSKAAITGGSAEAIDFENKIRNLKSNFDGYDSYLYNVSSSYVSSSIGVFYDASVPKTGSGTFADPFVPVSSSNSLFTNWYGAVNTKLGQIYSASLYDTDNPNRLVNLLPEHVREDIGNKQFLEFMDMIGQQFDELWLYTKNISEITDRQSDLSKGFSKDLVFNLAKSLGWDTQDGKDLLDLSRFGFGQKVTTVSGSNSYSLYTSGSLSSPPEGDISKEITKRLISSMPYILKSKGTIGSLKAIINCYGIPSSILRVREYGGIQKDNQKAQFEIARKFTRALGFRAGQHIKTTWVDDTNSSRKPETIEFRFRSLSGSNQVLVQKDDKWAIRLKDNGSTDNNGTVSFMLSGSSGYKEVSSSLLPVFDGEYHSVMLRKSKINTELFPFPSFEVSSNAGLFNPPFITGSNSAEFGSIEIVSSSNVARTGTKSLKHSNTSTDNTSYTYFYRNPDPTLYPGNTASLATVAVGETYLFSVYAKASGSEVDSLASINLFELDSNEEVVNWTQEFDYNTNNGGIKSSQNVGLNETEWKQIQVKKTIKFANTVKLGIRFENRKPNSSILFDDASLRKVSANTDAIGDAFSYDLFVKKYDAGMDRIRLSSKSNLIISSSVSQSYNAAWTGSGDLFIGGNSTTSFGANKLSGSMMEFRLWTEPLDEDKFDVHVATPKSYIGNSVSSSYTNLVRRFSFDDNTTLATNASIRDTSANQTYTQTGSAQGFSGANTFESVVDKTKTIIPNHGPNRRMATKIRIENNFLSGSGASLSVDKRADFSSNDYAPLDSPKLGIYFSPTDVINEDIVSSFANLDFNQFIGDPRDNFDEIYGSLKSVSDKYFQKYTGGNNFFDYIRLIKYYDQNIFKQLQKVIPARAKSNMGTLIEGNIFERPKSPVQRNNPVKTEPYYEKTINLSVLEPENEASRSVIIVGTEFPNFTGEIDSTDTFRTPSLYRFATNDNFSDRNFYISSSAKFGGPNKAFTEATSSFIENKKIPTNGNQIYNFFYTSSAEYEKSNRKTTSAGNRLYTDTDENGYLHFFTSKSLAHTDIDTGYTDITAFNNSFYEGVKNTIETTLDGTLPIITTRSSPTVAVPADGVIGDINVVDDT